LIASERVKTSAEKTRIAAPRTKKTDDFFLPDKDFLVFPPPD